MPGLTIPILRKTRSLGLKQLPAQTTRSDYFIYRKVYAWPVNVNTQRENGKMQLLGPGLNQVKAKLR